VLRAGPPLAAPRDMYEAVSPRTLRCAGRVFAVGVAVIIAATIRVTSWPRERPSSRRAGLELQRACELWSDPVLVSRAVDAWGTTLRGECSVHGDHVEYRLRSAGADRSFGTADDLVTLHHTTWLR
jgi:hypothetical protein